MDSCGSVEVDEVLTILFRCRTSPYIRIHHLFVHPFIHVALMSLKPVVAATKPFFPRYAAMRHTQGLLMINVNTRDRRIDRN